jgi:hypothetical protein
MQQLKKLYRSTYPGENVVTSLSLSGAEWNPEVEFIPNSVFNTFTTTQAIAIGNGESRLNLPLVHITNHRAGIGGANRLQSYACNAIYRDFTPDFLIAVGDEIVKEISESGYAADKIVYTNGHNLIEYPGKFYLIPQNIPFDAGALAVYLACFDGHKKVFLLGYDGYDGYNASAVNNIYKNTNGYPAGTEMQSGAFWRKSLHSVMSTYSDVEFIRVMPTEKWTIPEEFTNLLNFRQISTRDFVIESDLG